MTKSHNHMSVLSQNKIHKHVKSLKFYTLVLHVVKFLVMEQTPSLSLFNSLEEDFPSSSR